MLAVYALTVDIDPGAVRQGLHQQRISLHREGAVLRAKLAVRQTKIALGGIAADDEAALDHAGPAALGNGGALAPEQRDPAARQGVRCPGPGQQMLGLRLLLGSAVAAAHRPPTAAERQQQQRTKHKRHPEPRKIELPVPRPDDHPEGGRIAAAADIGGAHPAGYPVQRDGIFALIQRVDLQHRRAAVLPYFDRMDADTPVPYILGAYLIQLGLVGILVDRLVEGQPQLVAAQRFHPGDLRLGQLVAHVDRLRAADSAAQLRHGERQRLQPLSVQAFGDLGAYLKRRGKIGMLCLQLVPQPGRLTEDQPAAGRLLQRLKKLRLFGH